MQINPYRANTYKSGLPAIWKLLFERTFCVPCTSASVERVFNNGGYLLGDTDASKAQCIGCGNCFHSVAINQENKLFTG